MSGRTDRYTGRVDLEFLKAVEAQGIAADSGDDIYCLNPSATHPPRRITARRLAELHDRLSQRDRTVLRVLKDFRLATVAQLQAIVFHDHATDQTANRVARRTMNRLLELGAVTRLERRIGGIRAGSTGHVYSLAPVGHRLLGDTTRKRNHEPKLHHVKHTLAITDLAAQLHRASRDNDFEIEVLQTEPHCWRSPNDDNAKILKPDLHIRIANKNTELSWFIEIDLATESGTVLTRKLQAYTDYWRSGAEQEAHSVFPRVAWIAPDQNRADFIARTIEKGEGVEARLFSVTTAAMAVGLIAEFDESATGLR